MAKEAAFGTLTADQLGVALTTSIMSQFETSAPQIGGQGRGGRSRKISEVKPAVPAIRALRGEGNLSEFIDSGVFKQAVHAGVQETLRDQLGPGGKLVGEILILALGNARSEIVRAVAAKLPHTVERRQEELMQKQIDSIVDLYLSADPLTSVIPELATENAEARAEFLREFSTLTADKVADLAGHEAKNRSVTASRWKDKGLIFAVRHKGSDLYPAFEFKEGEPHPTVAKVLAQLPKSMSGWQIAFWFVGANGWLDGARPVDKLDAQKAVVEAARQEGLDWVG